MEATRKLRNDLVLTEGADTLDPVCLALIQLTVPLPRRMPVCSWRCPRQPPPPPPPHLLALVGYNAEHHLAPRVEGGRKSLAPSESPVAGVVGLHGTSRCQTHHRNGS
ncbi:unnamed protein product [Pylaiella littoralis]